MRSLGEKVEAVMQVVRRIPHRQTIAGTRYWVFAYVGFLRRIAFISNLCLMKEDEAGLEIRSRPDCSVACQ